MGGKYGKAVVNIAIAIVILLLLIFLAPKVLVFFMPFLCGWIIALIASPLVKFFEDKLKIRRKAGTAFVIIIVIAFVILISYFVMAKLTEEFVGFVDSLPALWRSMEADFKEIGENLSILYARLPEDVQTALTALWSGAEQYIGGLVGNIGTPTMNAVGNFAKNLPSILISIIMCILSAYFFTSDREYVSKLWRSILPPAVQEKWGIVLASLKSAVGGYLKAQAKIECWIYVLLVAGLMILKINYALLIAFGIAVLDFLPFFGTGAVMLPWALVKFLSGDYKMTIGLLIIWGVGQLARQLIQPKIVGDSIGMEPVPTLFLLFIGYKLAGVIGMIVAVPIGIILVNMNQAGVFDTVKKSVRILADGINRYRRLDGGEDGKE